MVAAFGWLGRGWLAEEFFAVLEGFFGGFVVRKDFERGTQATTGFTGVAQLQLANAHALPGAVMIWIKQKGLFGVVDGFFVFAHLPVEGCALVPAFGEFRKFFDDLIEEVEGFLEILLFGGLIGRLSELKCFGAAGVEPEVFEGFFGHGARAGLGGFDSLEELFFAAKLNEGAGSGPLAALVGDEETFVKILFVPAASLEKVERQEDATADKQHDISATQDGRGGSIHERKYAPAFVRAIGSST